VTLEELERTLPHGLHDAEVRRIEVDYQQRKVRLKVAVWVGDMDDPPERREAYRKGELRYRDLCFWRWIPRIQPIRSRAAEITWEKTRR